MAGCRGLAFLSSFLLLTFIAGAISVTEGVETVSGRPPYQPAATTTSNNQREISPANMTPISAHLAFVSSLAGEAKLFGGAFFLAVDELNSVAQRQGIPVNFTWSFHNTNNDEASSMKVMADLYCQKNISVFIGPDDFCYIAGLMATAYNIPYIAFNCNDLKTDFELYLMVNTKFYFGYASLGLMEVLRYFGWTSAWLVSGTDFKYQSTANLLLQKMHEAKIKVNGDTLEKMNDRYSPSSNETVYADFFKKTKGHTRVYIFLGAFESLILFVRTMKKVIKNSDEYVVLTADDGQVNPTLPNFYKYFSEIQGFNAVPSDAAAAFHNVLILSPGVQELDPQFLTEVYKRDLLPPINLPPMPDNIKRLQSIGTENHVKIPPTAYNLYDATFLYGQAVMNLTATPGADPLNGSSIIEWLKTHKHLSITNKTFYIRSNGRSEEMFDLYGSANKDGVLQDIFWKVGDFPYGEQNTSSIGYRHIRNITWSNGQAPVSNPECGFRNQLCAHESRTKENWIIIISVVVAFLVLCLLVGSLLIRKYIQYQENKRMRWKIDENELEYPSPDQVKEMLTPARSRKRKVSHNLLQSIYLAQSQEPDVIANGNADQLTRALPIIMYRGNRVFEKKLNFKDLDLPRPLVSQLKLMKDMSHENINEFKGACINSPIVRIITQYCPRRSLQDILEKDDLPLHDMFTTSIVQDIINGMGYIHDSKLGFHGNLKSSNCLVDSRWSVKICDFGLGIMKPARAQEEDDDSSLWKDLLWTAPELLPLIVCPSNDSSRNNSNSDPNLTNSLPTRSLLNHSTSNTSGNSNSGGRGGRKDSKFFSISQGKERPSAATGSQKGDVFSFAIILYELYGHAGPWGNPNKSAQEIVNSLLNSRAPTPRPDTTCLHKVNCDDRVVKLIEACWEDNPDNRPDFTGIRVKFQPIQQLLLSPNIIDNMLAKMEKYTDDLEVMVEERTDELKREKKMTDTLLLRMLPQSVAERLKRGQPVSPEQYEQVTIYFSDIVGFTEMSADSTPMEVVDLLNDLYTCFDNIIETFDVYKVETIGDAYMVVSGLPKRNGDRHAGEIASMALQLLDEIKIRQFKIRGQENNTLKIRIGIHSGPCCAGVVGKKMPRYCLFGDTINTASRLESTGEALKVHCSEDCKRILDKLGGYNLEQRGLTQMKGKGSLMTYFLVSEDAAHRHRRIKKTDAPWRCVSASNIDYSGRYSQLAPQTSVDVGRRRQGTGSCSLGAATPLVAYKDNNRSLTRITLPLLYSKSKQQEPWREDKRVCNSSLDNSIDSSCPGLLRPGGPQPGEHRSYSTPSSISDFVKDYQIVPCTSSQSVGQRNSWFMSPIAEDPRTPPRGTREDPSADGGIRDSSDSGSASMESTNSLPRSSIVRRDRVLSEPASALNDSSKGLHRPVKSRSVHAREPTVPYEHELNPLNSSFDHDRSSSEPPEWSYHKESPVFVETHSPVNHTSTSSSVPSIKLQEYEPREQDSPFSPDTIPSETDSLLESSWASSNHPVSKTESIPAKPWSGKADHTLVDLPHSPGATQAKTFTPVVQSELVFRNPSFDEDNDLSNSGDGTDSNRVCGETLF